MAALDAWMAALGGRRTAPATIAVMGDSNSEGTGAGHVTRRWQQMLQDQLRARFQPAGVAGAAISYICASPRTNPPLAGYPLTVSGAVSTASYGLGLRAAGFDADQALTFTSAATRLRLYGTKGPTVGRCGIRLDGGAEIVADGWRSGGIASGQLIWDSGPLQPGTHTLRVGRAASTTFDPGPVFPEGVLVHNGDEAAGIRVVDAARHGTQVGLFAGSQAWQTALAATDPGLLVMPWGANDVTAGTTPDGFRSGVEQVIASARAAGFDGSVLLVYMPRRGSADPVAWAEYGQQLCAVAAADPGVAMLDLRSRIPDHGTELGVYADDVHYTARGQGWIADEIAAAITPGRGC